MSEATTETDSSVEEYDAEKVAAAVAELTLDDLAPMIAEAGPNKLAALRQAEESGQERVGFFEMCDRRQAELDAADDDEDAPVSEPTEEEYAASERAKVEAAAWAPREPADVEEEPEPEWAPVDEIKPVIRVGDWVTLAASRGVPKHVVNLDAVVERANVRHSEGGDTLSPQGYEYQDDSDKFLVRVRNTGETLEVTRAAFSAHGTQQSELGFRS